MSESVHMDPRVRRTRLLLQESLLELLKTKTLNKIQIKQITENADISRHAFYTHFESKEDLLFSYCDDFIMPLKDAAFLKANHTGNLDLASLLTAMFEHWQAHKQVLKWVMQVENKDLFINRLQESVIAITEQWLQHLDVELHSRQDYIIDFVTGGVYMLLRRWLKDDMSPSASEIGYLTYQLSMACGVVVTNPSVLNELIKR